MSTNVPWEYPTYLKVNPHHEIFDDDRCLLLYAVNNSNVIQDFTGKTTPAFSGTASYTTVTKTLNQGTVNLKSFDTTNGPITTSGPPSCNLGDDFTILLVVNYVSSSGTEPGFISYTATAEASPGWSFRGDGTDLIFSYVDSDLQAHTITFEDQWPDFTSFSLRRIVLTRNAIQDRYEVWIGANSQAEGNPSVASASYNAGTKNTTTKGSKIESTFPGTGASDNVLYIGRRSQEVDDTITANFSFVCVMNRCLNYWEVEAWMDDPFLPLRREVQEVPSMRLTRPSKESLLAQWNEQFDTFIERFTPSSPYLNFDLITFQGDFLSADYALFSASYFRFLYHFHCFAMAAWMIYQVTQDTEILKKMQKLIYDIIACAIVEHEGDQFWLSNNDGSVVTHYDGIVQATSTTTSIKLESGAASSNSFYDTGFIVIDGETKTITAYNGTTKVATLSSALSSDPVGKAYHTYTVSLQLNETQFAAGALLLLQETAYRGPYWQYSVTFIKEQIVDKWGRRGVGGSTMDKLQQFSLCCLYLHKLGYTATPAPTGDNWPETNIHQSNWVPGFPPSANQRTQTYKEWGQMGVRVWLADPQDVADLLPPLDLAVTFNEGDTGGYPVQRIPNLTGSYRSGTRAMYRSLLMLMQQPSDWKSNLSAVDTSHANRDGAFYLAIKQCSPDLITTEEEELLKFTWNYRAFRANEMNPYAFGTDLAGGGNTNSSRIYFGAPFLFEREDFIDYLIATVRYDELWADSGSPWNNPGNSGYVNQNRQDGSTVLDGAKMFTIATLLYLTEIPAEGESHADVEATYPIQQSGFDFNSVDTSIRDYRATRLTNYATYSGATETHWELSIEGGTPFYFRTTVTGETTGSSNVLFSSLNVLDVWFPPAQQVVIRTRQKVSGEWSEWSDHITITSLGYITSYDKYLILSR